MTDIELAERIRRKITYLRENVPPRYNTTERAAYLTALLEVAVEVRNIIAEKYITTVLDEIRESITGENKTDNEQGGK